MPQLVTDIKKDYLAAATTTGQMLVFKVKNLPQMPKGKGNKILNVPTAKFAKGEEAIAGVAVFGEGKTLVVHTGKGELTVSPEEVDLYEGERTQRGGRLPKGYQEVKGIEVKE